MKNALRTLTKKLRNLSLISSTILFALFFFLLFYVTCLSISSFALSTASTLPAWFTARSSFSAAPLCFNLVLLGKGFRRNWERFANAAEQESQWRKERQRMRKARNRKRNRSTSDSRIRIKKASVPNMLSLSDKITLKPRTSRVNYNCTLDPRKMVVQYLVTETRRILP